MVLFTENSSVSLQGHESLASYESLEQLHRFVFVLGVTHVTYSFLAVALAMIKVKIVMNKPSSYSNFVV